MFVLPRRRVAVFHSPFPFPLSHVVQAAIPWPAQLASIPLVGNSAAGAAGAAVFETAIDC